MKILMVTAHPRRASLTHAVARTIAASMRSNGHDVESADLVSEGFDPVMHEPDEPDWNDADKEYSPAVQSEIARVARNDATVMVFPVWWWSMPAILKGWIDRVWNNGWAYGARSYPHRRVWMIAVAGNSDPTYTAQNFDQAMRIQLEIGLLEYCRIEERRLEFLFGAIEGNASLILTRAAELGAEF